MDRETILEALKRLSDLLGSRGITGEICLLGGTVMVLAFKARTATKDVDAIFHPPQVIRELARVVQTEMDLPDNWLNHGAKGYVSPRHEVVEGDLPQFDHLRLAAPTAEYMLAMKCMASRLPGGPEEPGDLQDIEFLVRRLNLSSVEAALAIVGKFYPESRVPARARFVLEDAFSRTHRKP